MKAILKGYVTQVGRNYFWWKFDTTCGPGEAQVAVKDLKPKERFFLKEGAYIVLLKGGTYRFLRVRWKKTQLERAKKRGQSLVKALRQPAMQTHETDL